MSQPQVGWGWVGGGVAGYFKKWIGKLDPF